MGNKFVVNDQEKNVAAELEQLKGKSIDSLSAAEAKKLTLIMAKMLGIVDATGKVKGAVK